MKKKGKLILIESLITSTSCVLIFWIMLNFTPKPLFNVVNLLRIKANITKPDNYMAIESNFKVEKNIIYCENNKNNLLDIYYPKKRKGKLPVIFFIHGGGFFKDEKEMAKYFGPAISNNQYAFVSIDYDLVPSVTIFDQLKQINQGIQFIADNADDYSLDLNYINLSGSSAVGVLALQLLSAYNDRSYAKEVKIEPVEVIKFNSLLLYNAIFDLSEFQHFEDNFITNYLLSKKGWGLTGKKGWENDNNLGKILNQNIHVSKEFPPIFITDGNTDTFTEQAKNYSKNLDNTGVMVQTLFFNTEENVGHGYQLNMHTSTSKKALKDSLTFLEKLNK